MTNQQIPLKGLTEQQALKLSQQYGKNQLTPKKKETFLIKLKIEHMNQKSPAIRWAFLLL